MSHETPASEDAVVNPDWKTRKFFEQDERSAELRKRTIVALSLFKALINQSSAELERDVRGSEEVEDLEEGDIQDVKVQFAALATAIKQLKEMGVAAQMHGELDDDALSGDPVKRAEFLAGELMDSVEVFLETATEEISPHPGGEKYSPAQVHVIARKLSQYATEVNLQAQMQEIERALDVDAG